MSPKTTTKHPRDTSGCTCIVCIQSPSGKGPKHNQCCYLLLWREKKQLEKEGNAQKELEQLSSDDELHQSANNSENHERHALPLKGQIDLNFKPEKGEESLPGSNKTTKNKTLHHDDTVKFSFKTASFIKCFIAKLTRKMKQNSRQTQKLQTPPHAPCRFCRLLLLQVEYIMMAETRKLWVNWLFHTPIAARVGRLVLPKKCAEVNKCSSQSVFNQQVGQDQVLVISGC